MPDIDTPNPEDQPTPDEIESWPSGRVPDELPQTSPSPDPLDQPDDPTTPAEAGDGLGQPSGGTTAAS